MAQGLRSACARGRLVVTRSGDSGRRGIGGTAMEIANPFSTALRGFALFWMTGLLGLAFAVGTAQPTHAEGARPSSSVASASVEPASGASRTVTPR